MNMKVKDIMEKIGVTISPTTTYEEVAKILYKNQISGVPVVSKADKLLGFVSEKDVFKVLYPFYKSYYENPEMYSDLEAREMKVREVRKHEVRTFMTETPVTVGINEPIMKVGALMLAKKVSRIPVVEKGKVVGMISRKMIYRAILKKYLIE